MPGKVLAAKRISGFGCRFGVFLHPRPVLASHRLFQTVEIHARRLTLWIGSRKGAPRMYFINQTRVLFMAGGSEMNESGES